MKVRIIQRTGYGAKTGRHHKFGEVVDLDTALAVKLLNYGIAEAVREAPHEKVTKAPAESTAKQAPKPRTRSSE